MNRPLSIVGSGVVAGSALLAAQGIDRAIAKNQLDDRVVLGRLAPIRRPWVIPIGTVLHLFNSVVFSAVFRLVVRDRLAGPMWWRGLLTGVGEIVSLYPMALLEDFHPAIRDGQLDSYQTPTAFWQQIWRHAVFGIVLGAVTPKRD